jgi:hypothetical protein
MKTAKPNQKTAAAPAAKPVVEDVLVEQPVIEEVVVVELEEPELEEIKPVVEQEVEEVQVQQESDLSKYFQTIEEAVPTIQMKDIERILRKSPHVTEVLLKSGDSVQLSTEDFQKLRDPEDPTSIISSL